MGKNIPLAETISLADAMNITIERITKSYAEDWLLLGQQDAGGTDALCIEKDGDGDYEYALRVESHTYMEIFVCLQGICSIRLEDSIYDVEEGRVCIITPGVRHCEMPKRNYDYKAVWMTVDFDILALHLSGKNNLDGFFYTIDGFTARSVYDYNSIYASLKKEIAEKKKRFMETAKALLLQILILISRNVENDKSTRNDKSLWKDSIVLQVRNFIDRNLTDGIRLGDISQEVCVSVNYLNSIFKSVTGQTIMQYVEDLKLQKARQLLKDTDVKIEIIACKLGYCDQYYFSKAFKKGTGLSPAQYRKRSI